VAEFTAIILLTPVLVTLFSAAVLKEAVSPLRWALVGGAFAGALVVIRPGSGLFGWPVLYPLGGTIAYAAFQVLTRRLAGVESPFTTHWWTGLTGSVIMLPLLLAFGPDVGAALHAASARDLGLLLLIGACGTFGHLLLILALGLAPPATLMPFIYTQLASAAVGAGLAQQGPGEPRRRVLLHDSRRALGADDTLVQWVVGVALDVAHLAVAQMDADAAPARAHVARRVARFGRRAGNGSRGRIVKGFRRH